MTFDIAKIQAEMAAKKAAAEQPKEEAKVASANRIYYGEFSTFQQYLTNTGKVVQFYQGYCMTSDPEIIAYCEGLRDVKEVTGKVNESDVPMTPKRERNRNWASAQGHSPHIFSPAELLQRVVVGNTSNTVPAVQSTSSN